MRKNKYSSNRSKIKRLQMVDKVQASEHGGIGGLRGEVIFGRGKHLVPYVDPFGNKTFITKFDEVYYRDHNIVPIGAYQFVFDKLFNIGLDEETTLRVGDLNDEAPLMKIGVPREEYKSIYYNAECSTTDGSLSINQGVNISALNYIFGFMMGDGAAKEDNITAIAPDYKNRTLYRAIPFRMSNDGTTIDQTKYFGQNTTYQASATTDPVTSYYIKKFDDPAPHIVHAWVTDNDDELSVVDDTVFSSTSSNSIESYVEMNISVDKHDGRGFFTTTGASPRVNEFALVSGWYNSSKNMWEACRIFTHFTRPSIQLSEGDTIEAIYRLYAR
jgi:hypothetical protein